MMTRGFYERIITGRDAMPRVSNAAQYNYYSFGLRRKALRLYGRWKTDNRI